MHGTKVETGKFSERGIILIAVLWIVLLLSVIALQFVRTTKTDVLITRNAVENARARALAEAAINAAILRLLRTNDQEPWIADGRVYELPFGRDRVSVTVEDEAGKIDLNTGSRSLLIALLRAAGASDEESEKLHDAIHDWRDGDSLRRIGGAEMEDYRQAGRSYGPKNANFDDVRELQQVLGMTPELYARVHSALTVHSKRRGVDRNAAPEIVLRAVLGNDDEAVSAALETRGSKPSPDGPGLDTASPRVQPTGRRKNRGAYTIGVLVQTEKNAVFSRSAIVQITGNEVRPVVFHSWTRSRRDDGMARSDTR